FVFFFSSRRRHTRFSRDWSSDVCSSDLTLEVEQVCLQQAATILERGSMTLVHHPAEASERGFHLDRPYSVGRQQLVGRDPQVERRESDCPAALLSPGDHARNRVTPSKHPRRGREVAASNR